VQHFTTINLYVELTVRNTCKNIFGRNIYVRSKFFCVHSSHNLCGMRAHAHLRGNIGHGYEMLASTWG